MTDTLNRPDANANVAWHLSRRIEAWAGEIRVNVIRIVAIALFYGRHLIELLIDRHGAAGGMYHLRVTAVIIAWAGAAGVIHLLLVRRHYPPMMKFATMILDMLMITLLCAIAGGPKTPMVLLYFAAITSAPLRLSLKLVWTATATAIVGYLVLLGYYVWYLVGSRIYFSTPEVRVPRSQEIITILAMLVTGLFAGQVVRQARRMVERVSHLSIAQEGQA